MKVAASYRARPFDDANDAISESAALRLENQGLRTRVRELERANEELLARLNPDRPACGSGGAAGAVPPMVSIEGIVCPNCGRNVPCANFDAHLVHCERNFFRCGACGEVVPSRDRDGHFARWTDAAWLLRAAACADLVTLRAMRAHGAVLEEAVSESGETLLHMAAASGSTELAAVALGSGAPSQTLLSAETGDGQVALHTAISSGHEAVAALLIESRADLEQRNASGDTPLIAACRRGSTLILRHLLARAADVEARTALGDTALQVAQSRGHLECALLLGQAGGTSRRGSKEGPSALIGPSLRPSLVGEMERSSFGERKASLPAMPALASRLAG